MLNGLDLFSGIGGISLALREWVRPIAYCEIDPYCQAVLLSRQFDGLLPNAPIWDDITSLRVRGNGRNIDIIYGGFPCQDISVAGHGKGLEGKRSGLFFEIVRLAQEIKPKFLFLENVPAITSRGGVEVVRQVTEMGYDCRWCVISAASVGALHRRERWFMLAHANNDGQPACSTGSRTGQDTAQRQLDKAEEHRQVERAGELPADVADTDSKRLEEDDLQRIASQEGQSRSRNNGVHCNTYSQPSIETDPRTESKHDRRQTRRDDTRQYWPFESREHWQEAVSRVCRTSDGVPCQVDRIKSLGNAVVPIQTKEAFKILMGLT